MWHTSSRAVLFLLTALLWVDVFTYQGYLQSVVHFPSKPLILVIFAMGAIIVYFNNKLTKPSLSQAPIIIGSLIFAIYCLIIAIEGSTGQGYIFTHLGLRPESMFLAVLSTLLTLTALQVKAFWNYIFISAIIFYCIRLMPIVVTQSAVTLKEVVRAPLATYDQKMNLLWGDFYSHMQEIKNTTPESYIVKIPSDVKKYPLEGNGALVRYFVYPRTVVVEDSL